MASYLGSVQHSGCAGRPRLPGRDAELSVSTFASGVLVEPVPPRCAVLVMASEAFDAPMVEAMRVRDVIEAGCSRLQPPVGMGEQSCGGEDGHGVVSGARADASRGEHIGWSAEPLAGDEFIHMSAVQAEDRPSGMDGFHLCAADLAVVGANGAGAVVWCDQGVAVGEQSLAWADTEDRCAG
ncbi:hypothetical protein IU450_39090 [Nocardia abscessus]|uniref:hypothetical protein n=1 Tax=Nocardia abscessus TaxID=120957 RepID=UPI001892DA9C|nr:hypothetical protein [Nocardia abscessus]MBF6341843.1 hypothetical protein [Nocardia abscessus]